MNNSILCNYINTINIKLKIQYQYKVWRASIVCKFIVNSTKLISPANSPGNFICYIA